MYGPFLHMSTGEEKKKDNPTPGAYVAHFRLGKAYIKEVIRVINPSVIMSFGIQACHVVSVLSSLLMILCQI